MLLNGGALDGKTYLGPATFKAMTTDHIGPGAGVARNYFYYPGDGFGFGYGFGVRTDPGFAIPPPPGSLGEIQMGRRDRRLYRGRPRAGHVLRGDAGCALGAACMSTPTIKKIIYDAFEK